MVCCLSSPYSIAPITHWYVHDVHNDISKWECVFYLLDNNDKSYRFQVQYWHIWNVLHDGFDAKNVHSKEGAFNTMNKDNYIFVKSGRSLALPNSVVNLLCLIFWWGIWKYFINPFRCRAAVRATSFQNNIIGILTIRLPLVDSCISSI